MGHGISSYRTQYGRPLTMILGLTSLLLLLACINLGGLLLTRWMTRGTELAVRIALGGSKVRIAQQMLLESLLLSLFGAIVALPVSYAFVASLVSFIPPGLVEPTISFAPDWRVLAATALIALTAGLFMTVLPLWLAMRRQAKAQFTWDRTIVGTTNYWARGLLVVQVAMSVVLLAGAGLLLRSLYLLQHTNLGVRTNGVLYARLMAIPGTTRTANLETYYPLLQTRLTGIPGVRTVELSRVFPRLTSDANTPISLRDQQHGDLTAYMEATSPGFFEALGIPLLAGRTLSWSDNATTRQVAVVSESLARALAPDGNVLERRVRFGTLRDFQDIVVVGVVGNATIGSPRNAAARVMYLAPLQMGRAATSMGLVIVADGDLSTIASQVRQVVRQVGDEYVHEIVSLKDLFARAPASERMSATLAGIVGALAVLLALIGTHGALAYSVSRRTREIGLRVAIGAQPGAVARAVVQESLALISMGLVIGLPSALLASRAIEAFLFGISKTDPLTLGGTIALFVAVGFAAGVAPARGAAAVDPVVALRTD